MYQCLLDFLLLFLEEREDNLEERFGLGDTLRFPHVRLASDNAMAIACL